MARNILFITTDQQRFDSLGCNGGTVARTPHADRLAAQGINFRRAYDQNAVCMPARSTMLTGQYPRTHGVVANGIALPTDAPTVAGYLRERGGYRTALIGKAHFEPGFDPHLRFEEGARAARGDTGDWRGFDYGKPEHWLAYYEGRWPNMEGGPAAFVPAGLTDDQVREVNAKTHIMNELVDEACGKVLATVDARGWGENTDVLFTTDHGELQGDMGLLYKGPFHVDALMRIPLIWRPAPSAGLAPAVVADPVGQVDLAPTFCAIAGIEPAGWMQGAALPRYDGEGDRQRMLCEWDSQFPGYGMHLRSIYRDGRLCTVYEPSTAGRPNGLERTWGDGVLAPCPVVYAATEKGPGGIAIATGELYRVEDDPHQWENHFDDPFFRAVRDDLIADLYDHLPRERRELLVDAPA